MKYIRLLFRLLSKKERLSFLIVVIFAVLSSLVEVAGVASIFPFLDLLSDLNNKSNNFLIDFISNSFNKDGADLVYMSGFTILFLIFLTTILKTVSTFLQIKFARNIEFSLSNRLISKYLNQNYEWFLNKNSTNLGKNLLQEVAYCCNGILLSLMKFITKLNLISFVVIMLFFVNAKVAFQVFTFFLCLGLVLFYCFKNFSKYYSNKRLDSDKARYKAVGEVFGAVKDVKVGSLEEEYIAKFIQPAKEFALVRSFQKLFVELPRFIIEGIILCGIIIFLLLFFNQKGNLTEKIPLISLYLFSIYKLMPAVLDAYSSISNFRFNIPSLLIIYNDLKKSYDFPAKINRARDLPKYKNIVFRDIKYKYPASNKFALDKINIKIKKGTSNGFAGFTGSGKTTLIDIFLGLLIPQEGELLIDETKINSDNIKNWQKEIGYVSQQIYLSDDTIANNIAFGIPFEEIKWNKLYKATKIACVDEFVSKLEDKYLTIVGERGVKLSGGQRQRIGLARALYKSPSILVLDEATSALDNITEKLVMKNIYQDSNNITLIIIAHRISTIENCDKIFVLKNGKIEAKGNYFELLKESPLFNKLALN